MKHRPANSALLNQRGVSLIELMIALLVGLLVVGGLLQVYLSSKQGYNAQEQLARMQESGRFGMDLITTDLRRSGYWGGSVDLRRLGAGPPDAAPLLTGGNPGPEPPAHRCEADNTWGRMIRWRVSGRNNTSAGYGCATGYDAAIASDVLALRYAGPNPIVGPTNANGLYLRDNTEAGVIMTGATAGDPDNEPPPVDGNNVDPVVRALVSNAYYVGDSGRTCQGGVAIPALMRVRLAPDSGLPVADEIASGVERFEVLYLLDGAYVNAAAVDAADGEGWLRVRAVRIWLLVRGECPEQGLTDGGTYTLADAAPFAPNDNFRRQLYVSTVMLRNTVVGDVAN